MKFSQIPYERPDIGAVLEQLEELTRRLQAAGSAAEQLAIYREEEALTAHLYTQMSVCSIRHTVDTRDAFYDQEHQFLSEQGPLVNEKLQAFQKALLRSPHRAGLEEALGSLLFTNLELEEKGFSPEIIPLMQEEAKLSNEYESLYASARVPFLGAERTIAQLGPYKEDPDRGVRKAALEAEGGFFDAHREQFDELYDRLVKNRTEQARRLGFSSYVELGFIRMGRNCYTPQDIASFREQVVRDLVPLTVQVKARQAKRLDMRCAWLWLYYRRRLAGRGRHG